MNSIRVKICGITSVADAQIAVKAGADAIGLVFYAPSPRAVSIELAREIASSVGPFVTVVGLFVDAEESYVHEVLANVSLHVLQFHGAETREFCEQFQRPYMKAIRMRPELDVVQAIPCIRCGCERWCRIRTRQKRPKKGRAIYSKC